jgi:acetoacetate decarboxylase
MNIDPKKSYNMPMIMEPWGIKKEVGARVYDDEQIVALQFRTTPDAIPPLIPDCYQPIGEPTVTVAFIDNNGVDFMAGRGYRIAFMSVKVRFDGIQDHVEGDYMLAIFENDTFPIILGRENIGVPKLFADISPIRVLPNGHIRCEASLWGHLLFGIDVGPLVKQDDSMVSAVNEEPQGPPMLGYKYIPSFDDTPDTAYPTSTPSDSKTEQLWLGTSGNLFFGNPTAADISSIASIIDKLKTLPVQQVIGVSRSRGSSVLRMDLSCRLR